MQIPVIHLERVYHVGTMDPARLGSNTGRSLEGHCLSVSVCPDAWETIARLGGDPWHALDRPEGAFLDVHAVVGDPDLLASAKDWAVGEGLAARAKAWRLWRYDDETESWGYMAFDTRADAVEEADADEDFGDAEDAEGPDGCPGIEEFEIVRATPALLAATGMKLDPSDDATDAVLMRWASQVAGEAVPGGLDGLWWAEELDAVIHSAPRAGIFPERVAEWATSRIPTGSVDDEEGLASVPDPVGYDLPQGPSPR